jgi:hypothetical protein
MDAAVGNKTGAAALGTEGTVFAGAPISGALTLLTLASIMYCSVYTYTHIYKGYTNVVSVVSALGFYWLFFCGWGRIQRGLRHAWQRVCTPLSTCGAGWHPPSTPGNRPPGHRRVSALRMGLGAAPAACGQRGCVASPFRLSPATRTDRAFPSRLLVCRGARRTHRPLVAPGSDMRRFSPRKTPSRPARPNRGVNKRLG